MHELSMFLLAQLFSREAQRPDTVEYWPAGNSGGDHTATTTTGVSLTGSELTSPTRQLAKSGSGSGGEAAGRI